ncbi:hypothetical protein [Adhaeribacter pallidiroseus]|uniref:Uncharacterized protein n=1 Tax=Adhaeribacter pallidiroseus TaxID=2072847 RepID=A0A369QJX6_9BACT|nr:hypothetical protein [Adhaeribacter pallidiroseus]RDC65034.1 hypothetical protein AHMF7616_03657 [Adhaeribacter pallidiroseus]
MIHRGEVVEQKVRNSDMKIVKVAEALAITRNTLYVRFQTPNLDLDFIKRVGKIIHYDFSQDIPELKTSQETLSELPEESVTELQSLSECTKALLNLQKKYIALLEKHNELLTTMNFAKG